MKAFMTMGLLLGTLATAACMEPPAASEAKQYTDQATSRTIGDGDAITIEHMEATTDVGDDTIAHTNCGHMLYCRDANGRPEYACYANSGCNLHDWLADAYSDCVAVCGASVCGFYDIQYPSSCALQ